MKMPLILWMAAETGLSFSTTVRKYEQSKKNFSYIKNQQNPVLTTAWSFDEICNSLGPLHSYKCHYHENVSKMIREEKKETQRGESPPGAKCTLATRATQVPHDWLLSRSWIPCVFLIEWFWGSFLALLSYPRIYSNVDSCSLLEVT